MGDVKRPRVGRPPSARVDRAVLAAAVDVLAEVGLEAFTVAEVARRAGSTAPAVYRRYADKTALVIAAVEHEVAAVTSSGDSMTRPTDLHAELLQWARMIRQALTPQRVRILAALTFARADSPEPTARLAQELRSQGDREWQGIIQRAVDRGELRDHDHPAVLGVLPSAVITTMALFGDEPADDNVIEALVDDVLMPLLRRDEPSAPEPRNDPARPQEARR